jgi:hypothetical protein
MKDFNPESPPVLWSQIGAGLLTFFLLQYSRLPSPVIVMFFLLLGWLV